MSLVRRARSFVYVVAESSLSRVFRDRAKRGVERAEPLVLPREQSRRFGVRLGCRSDAHDRVAGRVNVVPRARADSCEQRSAVSRAFFGLDRLDRAPVNVGLNLSPRCGAIGLS